MTTPTATRLTARCTDDLLAMVPVALGFAPEDSLVVLTFEADRAFHARVDLPDRPEDDDGVVEMLLAPARHHRVRRAALLVYAGPDRAADAIRVGALLDRAFREAGIGVVDAVRADGARWYALHEPADPGVPYDVAGHRFTAQAVLDGRAVLSSRTELSDRLAPDPAGVTRVAGLAAFSREVDLLTASGVTATIDDHVATGRLPDEVLLDVLRSIRVPAIRDGAWVHLTRGTADDHVRLWTDAVRRAPEPLRGSAAAVLAFAAWLSGDGALAWCAIDRCAAVDPDNSLADLVGELLQGAVSPDAYAEVAITSRGG